MNKENLTIARNLILRAALISIGMTWLTALATMGLWDTWVQVVSTNFRVSSEFLSELVTQFFTCAKFFSIYLLLVPGLALHWTVKKMS